MPEKGQGAPETQTPPSQSGEIPPKNPQPDKEAPAPKPKKRFNRSGDVPKFIPIKIIFPTILPDFDPFEFDLRFSLSQDAEDKRQEWMQKSVSEQLTQENEQYLDQIGDLLVNLPRGFEDLVELPSGPGESFKSYVRTCPDPHVKELLNMIVRGVNTAYWNAISPREFRGEVQGRGA